MSVDVEVQNPNEYQYLPSLVDLKDWCQAALQGEKKDSPQTDYSVLVRVVDEVESADLNGTYREKKGPTNILSFPTELPDFMLDIPDLKEQASHLGDLIVCEPVMRQEASEQNKPVLAHWAHLIVHGVLHLQGFDHIDATEAQHMEALEIAILDQLGYSNPYADMTTQ